MRSFLLAIDAGSSSIRCTAYEYHPHHGGGGGGSGTSDSNKHLALLSSSSSSTQPPPLVTAVKGVSHAIPLEAIVPITGHIRIHEVLEAIDNCVDETLKLLRQRMLSCDLTHSYPHQVVAIGFSTFVMNFVALDIYGDPVGDVATCSYACNRDDVVEECQRLRESLGAESLHEMYQRSGTPLHTSYALPQLRAFYGNKDNEAIAKTIDKWSTISSICLYRWSGRPQIQMPISYSEASWTGMLNFRTCSWDDQMVDLVETCDGVVQYTEDDLLEDEEYTEVVDLLPPLADFDAALPFLREGIPRYNDDRSENSYWERWPELRSYPMHLFFGVGDGAAANIGSKCSGISTSEHPVGSQRIAVTVGTSAAARVCLNLPLSLYPGVDESKITIPPGLFCYRVHRDRILLGGALTDGGSVVEWARTMLNLQSNESFDACLGQVSEAYEQERTMAGSSASMRGEVTMIPFLSGERSTGFRGGAKGCISGLTRETTPSHVMYACLESVTLRICCILQLIHEVCTSQYISGQKPNQCIIVASGKALERNTLWRQMLADCSSMDVVIDDGSREGTSRGVAMLMAASLQRSEFSGSFATFNNIDEPLNVSGIEKPNAAVSDRWKIAKLAQESLIEAIAPTWNKR